MQRLRQARYRLAVSLLCGSVLFGGLASVGSSALGSGDANAGAVLLAGHTFTDYPLAISWDGTLGKATVHAQVVDIGVNRCAEPTKSPFSLNVRLPGKHESSFRMSDDERRAVGTNQTCDRALGLIVYQFTVPYHPQRGTPYTDEVKVTFKQVPPFTTLVSSCPDPGGRSGLRVTCGTDLGKQAHVEFSHPLG